MKDYYKILGVKEEASEEEIHARWIELGKHYHPDLRKTEEGDEKIKEINEAYEILKDEPARFQYDFERDLKRPFIKKAHLRQERETSIRKIIMISSGMVVLFLIVSFILSRSGRVVTPPGPMAKTEVLQEIDKGREKMTASRTLPVEISPKAQSEGKAPMKMKEAVIPPESKKEAMLPESTEMASLRPPPSPAGVERESEQKKEPVLTILPEPKVPERVEKELPAKEELEKGRLTPQVVMRPEIPAMEEVSREVPKETPKPVAEEIPKEVPKETPKQIPREVSKEVPGEGPREVPPKEVPPKEIPKEIVKEVSREVPEEVLREVPEEVPKEVAREVPKETPKEVPKEVPKETPKEVPKETPKEVPKEISAQVARQIPKESRKEVAKEVAGQVPKKLPKEISIVTFHPGEQLTMWTKGERVVSSRTPLLAKEEEVQQFFSDYVDRYHRKDVGGFLSLFSSKAIQNQTERSESIRSFYTKFFSQSQDLRYHIEAMNIEISQYRVDVKARFRVDQKLKKDGEEKVWKGKIRWVLVKEGGSLKISSLDYRNEKFP